MRKLFFKEIDDEICENIAAIKQHMADNNLKEFTTGDMIRVKTEEKEIVTGRIAKIWHDEGWGVLKEVNQPHEAHVFQIRDIKEKI